MKTFNKISALKLLDKVVGIPLVFFLLLTRRNRSRSPHGIKDILLIRPGGIGDAVLLLPALHSLKEQFPNARIDVLCEKRNADIFKLSSDINTIYLYDRGLDLLKVLRKPYDVVIDTEQWHRLSAVVARLTGAPVRIGFDTNERRKLFTHCIPYGHDDYEVYSFFHLLAPLTGKINHFKIDEPFIDISSDACCSLPSETEIKDNLIALLPGASVKAKKWGIEKFGEVARTFSSKGYRIVLLGSHADQRDAEEIEEYANCLNLTGKTSLRYAATILRMSRLLITADSGLMHLAYGVGTPTISIFGCSVEKKWAPPGRKHTVINKRLSCSPCTKFGY
ncbi:MAG TPA: glycosyltransferase family 9 protein, partial [Thermodesulfovibrionales bacterium]|nr:glycosyltransferase family 9 protein [Thermodesulfovibrionales bacterium]